MDFFGIGALEALVILVVALLAVGPERLPKVARRLGLLIDQARRSVAEARETFLMDIDLDEGEKPVAADRRSTGSDVESSPSDPSSV